MAVGLASGEGRHEGDELSFGEGRSPIGKFVVDGWFDVWKVESESVAEPDFLPKTGEGGCGGLKSFGVRAGFLGKLGEVFH